MSLDNFDFTPEKKKKQKKRPKTKWYKCANKKCRAVIAESLHKHYKTCPFCNKTEWFSPDQHTAY